MEDLELELDLKIVDDMYDQGYRRGIFDKRNGRPKADLEKSTIIESWKWGYEDGWAD